MRVYHHPVVSLVFPSEHLRVAHHLLDLLQVCGCRRPDDGLWGPASMSGTEAATDDDGTCAVGGENGDDSDVQKRVVSPGALLFL